MIDQIVVGILVAFILWIVKTISSVLKKCYEPVENKSGKVKAERNFHQNYKERHGQLKVSCVGMEGPRSLDDIYVDVQFLDKKSASKHGGTKDLEKAFREREKNRSGSSSNNRQDGMRVANDEQYLMVIGAPGIGKSTFLRKVGLEASRGNEGNFAHQCLPIFVELQRLNEESIDIESLISEELEILCAYRNPKKVTESKLVSGELLVLFDGLDEVRMANVENVIRKITDFVDRYQKNRFIVSCRVAAYKGGFRRFKDVEIVEFDDSQIQNYIENWFASAPARAQQCWETLQQREHRAIRALAENPLSLVFLCIVYDDTSDFPSNRATLYESALSIFLKKWREEKQVRQDSEISQYVAVVEEMLSYIAAENFKADRLLFSERKLTNQIQEFCQQPSGKELSEFKPTEIQDAILVDPGLIVERTNRVYSFFHLAFQEYLTANHFVRTQSIQNLASYQHNEQWREVFLFSAEIQGEADNLLTAMKGEASKSMNTDGVKTLFQWAKEITGVADDKYHAIAKRAIAIHQYISLRLLNETHEMVKANVTSESCLDLYRSLNSNFNVNRYFRHYFNLDSYKDFYRHRHREISLNRKLYVDLRRVLKDTPDSNLYRYLDHYQDLFLHRFRDLNRNLYLPLYLTHDFYQYTDADFYSSVPALYVEHFGMELGIRIELIQRIEAANIFTGVDLQQMVRRFNEQLDFIKAARLGKPIPPSETSIHDTWLSTLRITNDMIAIPHEVLENYVQYLRAMELIVACKEAAESVSPDVWEAIEDRFLESDMGDLTVARGNI